MEAILKTLNLKERGKLGYQAKFALSLSKKKEKFDKLSNMIFMVSIKHQTLYTFVLTIIK